MPEVTPLISAFREGFCGALWLALDLVFSGHPVEATRRFILGRPRAAAIRARLQGK